LMARVLGKVTMFDFGGPLSFGAAADLGHHVRERVKGQTRAIILDFSRVPFIDVSAARAIETIIHDSHDMGITVFETSMNEGVRNTLINLNSLQKLPVDVTYSTRVEALRAAVALVEAERSA
jgi:SulP family sulfate permease